MKIKKCFVSNSSTSSFILVGFPSRRLYPSDANGIDYKKVVLEHMKKRDLDRFAVENIRDDEKYKKYSDGTLEGDFWELVYNKFDLWYVSLNDPRLKGKLNNPITTAVLSSNGGNEHEEWIGIKVHEYEGNSISRIDMIKFQKAIDTMKKTFPGIEPEIVQYLSLD